jgi:acetoin utilization deacetylase AcuC-like enzyme
MPENIGGNRNPGTFGIVYYDGMIPPEFDSVVTLEGIHKRYDRLMDLCRREAAGKFVLHDPREAKAVYVQHILSQTHDARYLRSLKERFVSDGGWPGSSEVLAKGAFESASSSILAAQLIADGKHKFVIAVASGQHHAGRARGGGFCAINDVAAAVALFEERGLRPIVIDIDIHAGDGTQECLWGSSTPTISIHAGSIYPVDPETRDLAMMGKTHTRHWLDNHAYNFVLEDAADDDSLHNALDAVDSIVREYKPDVIIFVGGADGHVGTSDVLDTANASFTYRGFDAAADRIHAWAEEFGSGRVLMTTAGGYQPLDHTPRIWANMALILAGVR